MWPAREWHLDQVTAGGTASGSPSAVARWGRDPREAETLRNIVPFVGHSPFGDRVAVGACARPLSAGVTLVPCLLPLGVGGAPECTSCRLPHLVAAGHGPLSPVTPHPCLSHWDRAETGRST